MPTDDRTTPALGRLLPVAPRDIWSHEALAFTPWLLQNVDVLSDLLGIDLVLDVAEYPVGDFSLDIKGYDAANNEIVIVENQLGVSDHLHLGQIITYAAGTDPTTIVWVTTGFRPEHRAAIDWLNQRTDDNTRVFGVMIRVVQIGSSLPAPNFELVVQPNDWEKSVKKAISAVPDSPRQQLYREFWELALRRIRADYPSWTRASATSDSWINTTTGTRDVVISMSWTREGLVAQINFESSDADRNANRFHALYEQRAQFDEALGQPAEWDSMDGYKKTRITIRSPYKDPTQTDLWAKMIDWLITTQIAFRRALTIIKVST